jgi:Zn-dependent protease with chaperone function
VKTDDPARMAMGLATLVHLLTTLLIALGVGLLFTARKFPLVEVLALGCFALAYTLRPRLGRVPRKAVILTRQSHPMTFQLVDSIAGQLQSPKFDLIVLDSGPNAATGRVGMRRRRVLYVGAALWSGLEWDERCAVLTHELGHNVNHDVRRGDLLATSIGALTVWVNVLTPKTPVHHWPEALLRSVLSPLCRLAIRTLHAQLRLSSGVSRLAEYKADDISASAAGTEAAVRTLDKVLIVGSSMDRLLKTALYAPQADLWAGEKRYVDSFPPRQLRRLRFVDQSSPSDIYSTHPNISRRISYLMSEAVAPSRTSLTQERLSAVDRELTPQLRQLARDILNQVRKRSTPSQLQARGQY